MHTEGRTFTDETVELDGRGYENCRFLRCRVVYRGEGETRLVGNDFQDCDFALEGAASHTMGFLKGMADSSDGFLITFLKALSLDPARLARLAASPPR